MDGGTYPDWFDAVYWWATHSESKKRQPLFDETAWGLLGQDGCPRRRFRKESINSMLAARAAGGREWLAYGVHPLDKGTLYRHFTENALVYFAGNGRADRQLVCIDLDAHADPAAPVDRAKGIITSLVSDLYWERSRSGKGWHGYAVLDQPGSTPEQRNENAQCWVKSLRAQVQESDPAAASTIDACKGAPTVTSWRKLNSGRYALRYDNMGSLVNFPLLRDADAGNKIDKERLALLPKRFHDLFSDISEDRTFALASLLSLRPIPLEAIEQDTGAKALTPLTTPVLLRVKSAPGLSGGQQDAYARALESGDWQDRKLIGYRLARLVYGDEMSLDQYVLFYEAHVARNKMKSVEKRRAQLADAYQYAKAHHEPASGAGYHAGEYAFVEFSEDEGKQYAPGNSIIRPELVKAVVYLSEHPGHAQDRYAFTLGRARIRRFCEALHGAGTLASKHSNGAVISGAIRLAVDKGWVEMIDEHRHVPGQPERSVSRKHIPGQAHPRHAEFMALYGVAVLEASNVVARKKKQDAGRQERIDLAYAAARRAGRESVKLRGVG